MPDKQLGAARRGAVLAMLAVLWLGGRAWASSTATVTIGGSEQSGDAASITLSFNGFSETVSYGQYSTPAAIASAFGGMFSRDDLPSGLCANASGAVVTFKLQSGSFGTLDVTGSTASFQVSSSGFSSQSGGSAADSGIITLTVGGVVAAQTNYGSGATQASVAAGLAAGVTSGSYVTVTASGNTLQLQSKQAGAGTNYSYALATTSYDSTDFSQPSFMNPPASGSLTGGADAGSGTPQTVYSYAPGYDAAGNVLNYTDAVMGAWTMGYDNLNRIASAVPATGNPSNGGLSLCWSYDSFGNRTAQDAQSGACPAQPAATASYNANNQVTWTTVNAAAGGFAYDAAGDVTDDGVNQYLYDAEGRICAVASTPANGYTTMTGYLYDAEGNRIAKGTIQNMTSCDPAVNGFVAASEVDSIRDQNGQQIAETAMDPSTGAMVSSHANVWAAGTLLATYSTIQSGAPLSFYFNDPLGTRRIETDYAGNVLESCSSLPFGDGETCQPTPTEHLFTGKERDAESGLDYFGARYYASSMGRFISPDPTGLLYADPTNPQSLNLYSYALNNPLINIDPNGEECVWDDGSFDSADDAQTGSLDKCSGQGGTWIDPTAFGTLGLGDWSPNANSQLAGIAAQMNPTTFVQVTANSDGSVSTTSATAYSLLGFQQCAAVQFKVTGVGPGQAPGNGAFTGAPPANNQVAIKPQNFGIPYSTPAQRAAAQSGGVKSAITNTVIFPNYGTATTPSNVPQTPFGAPSGPYSPADAIGPASVRNSPGNQIDVYRYSSQQNALSSTRTTTPTIFVPNNTAGVTCP